VFHFAALGECNRILDYLISIAPPPLMQEPNFMEETPLHWACSAGSISNVEMLLAAGADYSAQDNCGNSILHTAVQAGHYSVTNYIIRNKLCRVEQKNTSGNSALAVACEENVLNIAQLLVRFGADSSTLLLHYIAENKPSVVKILLSGGFCKFDNFYLRNPLHYAVSHNNYKVARVLIRANADWKDETDRYGNKPANLLRSYSNKKLASLLA